MNQRRDRLQTPTESIPVCGERVRACAATLPAGQTTGPAQSASIRVTTCILASVLILAGCQRPAPEAAPSPDPRVQGEHIEFPSNSRQLSALSVGKVQSATSPATQLAGRVVWDDNATTRIYAAFGGRISTIHADAGDPVSTNSVLATLVSPDFGQAQSDANRAASDFRLAGRTRARVHELFEHGAAAQKDVESAEADFSRAQSERARAEAKVHLYGELKEDAVNQFFPITSPIAGVVVERNVNPGQELRSDAMLANSDRLSAPLFVVTDPGHVWVLIDVAEQDLASVRPGQSIRVSSRAFLGESFTGTIDKVADALDLATRMVRVRAAVSNPHHRLKAEMLVTVEVLDTQQAVTEVPITAVFTKGDQHFVYRVEAPGRFSRQLVRVGSQHSGQIIVLEGLRLGEQVVTDGCLLLEQIREDASPS